MLFKSANLALSFLLELSALAALGYWGFQTGPSTLLKILLGIGAPLLAAVIWGLFAAPKASRRLRGFALYLLKAAVFVTAILALAAAGQGTLAGIFAVAVLVNFILTALWRQNDAVVV